MEITYSPDVSVTVYEATQYRIKKTTILAVMAVNTSKVATEFVFLVVNFMTSVVAG
jgi:hypothetical protein